MSMVKIENVYKNNCIVCMIWTWDQTKCELGKCGSSFGEEEEYDAEQQIIECNTQAVSYTHLDVYKRQTPQGCLY